MSDPFERPALFSNNMALSVGNGFARISFGEAYPGYTAPYHTSIVLANSDAMKLAELIYETINRAKASRPIITPGEFMKQ